MNAPFKRKNWQSLIDLWKESGLSKSRFCKKQGLRTSSFTTALNRLESLVPDPLLKKEFVKAKIIKSPSPLLNDCVIELPNKVLIKINQASFDFIMQLIRKSGEL